MLRDISEENHCSLVTNTVVNAGMCEFMYYSTSTSVLWWYL